VTVDVLVAVWLTVPVPCKGSARDGRRAVAVWLTVLCL